MYSSLVTCLAPTGWWRVRRLYICQAPLSNHVIVSADRYDGGATARGRLLRGDDGGHANDFEKAAVSWSLKPTSRTYAIQHAAKPGMLLQLQTLVQNRLQ